MEVGLAGFSHMYSEPFTAKLMSPSDSSKDNSNKMYFDYLYSLYLV